MQSYTITVDDGRVKVPVKNLQGEEVGEFYFNPADVGIVSRYNILMEELPNVIQEGDIDTESLKSTGDSINNVTEKVYKLVNDFLGSDDAAAAFFGKINPFALCGGKLYLENVLNAVGAFIDSQFDTQTKKFQAKIDKYTKDLK